MFKTNYSFRQAIGNPSDIIPILKEYGWTHAPIADIASTYGWVEWRKECEKHGLKPVYGVTLAVSPNPSAKKPITDLWSFYAIDDIAPINELVRLATSQFRYQAMLTYEQAMAATNVIRIAGHRAMLDRVEPQKNFYVGLSPACSKGYVRAALERGLDFIAFQDNRYPAVDDFKWWEISCGRAASRQTYPQHILSWDEWNSVMRENLGDLMETIEYERA